MPPEAPPLPLEAAGLPPLPLRRGEASRPDLPGRACDFPLRAMGFSVAGRYRSVMIAIIATVFAALAALLHVYIFVMVSVQWTQPKIWKRFGVADQAAAEITKPDGTWL